MRKFLISVFFILIIPVVVYAGFSFGLIKAAKKTGDKVDEKVAQRKASLLYAQTPTVPTNLTAIAVSSSQINLSWTASSDDVGVTNYKIYRNAGVTPIAMPTGTTYSNTGLTASTAYSYTVSACDGVGNCSGQSSAASDTTLPPIVGGEWVLVPGNLSLGTNDFYVMKYEAKNVGGVATSQADVTPWSYINHPTAVAACAALGAGHHLITIAEAQTINRNIEAQSANWANGIIGSLVSAGGGLKRGNVGITDSASYAGGAAEYGASRNLKAKLVLSNGEEIWDWSGNVWEWIYGTGAGGTLGAPDGVAFYATSAWYEWNSVTPDLNQERPVLGPSNSNWTGAYGVGSYYGGAPTKAPRRGGPWADGAFAGVFSFCAEASTSDSINTFGFRCGKSPDTQAPTVPTNLSAVAVSSSQINLSWTASTDNVGVTNYKIYRNGGVTPIAMPTGTTYSNTGLTASTAYSYTVSACDAVDNCSGQSSSASDTTPTPPAAGGEWVFVPGNSSIGTNDFWVMQYEAKNVSGIATSQAVITPWVNIDLSSSIAACSALGSGYHLLTIAEAQTVNRNIEAQTANWANGIIGSLVSAGGGLKRGNLSITDSASYIGATPEFGTGRDAKAKLVLSNGGEIWDWSGNVSEWIYGAGATGTQGTPGGVTFNTSGWYDWSSTSPDLSQERPLLGPSNSSWTSAYGVGKYFGGLTTNAVIRGGGWPDDVSAGVFTFNAFYAPSSSLVSNGFRCGR